MTNVYIFLTSALLSHQKSRMEKLVEDLKLAEDRLQHLKNDVTLLECRVIERKRQKSNVFPSVSIVECICYITSCLLWITYGTIVYCK